MQLSVYLENIFDTKVIFWLSFFSLSLLSWHFSFYWICAQASRFWALITWTFLWEFCNCLIFCLKAKWWIIKIEMAEIFSFQVECYREWSKRSIFLTFSKKTTVSLKIIRLMGLFWYKYFLSNLKFFKCLNAFLYLFTSNFRFELNAFRRVTLLLCSTCPTSGSFSWLVRMPRQQLTTFSPTGFFDTFQQPCQEYKWVLQIARVSFIIHKDTEKER